MADQDPSSLSQGELDAAQGRLSRALDRARAGEDRELAAVVRDDGLQLVRLLYGLIHMTRLHEVTNQAFEKPLAELTSLLERLLDLLGVIHCIAVEDQIYLNDIRIRFSERGEGGAMLGTDLRRLGVGGLSFQLSPSQEDLRVLVQAFAPPPVGVSDRTELRARLDAAGVTTIDLHGLFRFRMSGSEERMTDQDSLLAARHATTAVDETWGDVAAERMPNPLPLRRVVTELLESGAKTGGLWEAPQGASAFGSHTLRVTRYAVLLAEAVGLEPEAVQDLGLAAMFHDIGYASREGVRASTGPGDPGDPGYSPPYERHTSAGARLLLRQRGFHEAKIRRALATLEHHRDYDDPAGRPCLFARILRICEDYDNLVRRGAGRRSPGIALGLIQAGVGTRYDPVLAQAFMNMMGRFPPGSMLELEDGRIVRAVTLARSPETWDKPLCQVEADQHGVLAEGEAPRMVDLALEGKVVRDLGGI